jgi:conjugative relaxase-like TrwC/TraI family protein
VTVHLTKIDTSDYGAYLVKEAEGPARYYTREAPCQWAGRGAKRHFGRTGEATPEEVSNILSGKSPDGLPLGLKKGARFRPGVDACVDYDKAVSLIRYLGPEKARTVIRRCCEEAADCMFQYAEDNLAWTRRGKGGQIREQLDTLTAFRVEHDRSRENQLAGHHHYAIANHGRCADGTWRTLDAKPLWDNQLCLSAIHQQQLSYLLERELGLLTERATRTAYENGEKVTRKQNWFTCPDVSPDAVAHFSKRRRQILKDMEERGAHGAKEAKRSGERTRKKKDYSLSTEEIVLRSKEEAAQFGLTEDSISQMFGKAPSRTEPLSERIDRAIESGVKLLSEKQAHWSKHDLVRYACTEGISEGIPAPLLIAAVEHRLEHSSEFVRRGDHPRDVRYTTRANYELEQVLLKNAETLHERSGHAAPEKTLKRVLSRRKWETLRDEQRAAVTRITTGKDLALVTGMAGTGKSFMLGCAKEVWEAQNLKVIGAAFTGRAGVLLEKESGIKTSTIHRLLLDLDSGLKQDLLHHGKQLLRAARGKPTYPRQRITLDGSSVLVIDETGQVPTHLLKRVLDHCERVGAKIVCVGDARQVQPIAPGGPFKSLTERFPQLTAALKDVRRQKEAWQIEAVHHFADGDARAGLELFRQHGCLTVTKDPADTLRRMVDDWAKAGGVKSPQKHFLLATTRADVARLNRLAQEKRLEAKKLPGFRVRVTPKSLYLGTPHIEDGEDKILEGDRVMLGRNFTVFERKNSWFGTKSEGRKVSNGDLATVLRIDQVKDTVTLALDEQKKPLILSLKDYNRYGSAIHLGFSATVYKSQGSSIQHVYVQAGADRELSYVATSRHKVRCQLYATEADLEDDGAELIRTMSKSHQKDLFLDVPGKNQSPTPELSLEQ